MIKDSQVYKRIQDFQNLDKVSGNRIEALYKALGYDSKHYLLLILKLGKVEPLRFRLAILKGILGVTDKDLAEHFKNASNVKNREEIANAIKSFKDDK